MKQSESIIKLTEALIKVQAKMENAKKTADNPFFKRKYADLATVLDTIRDLLAANGLAIIQPVEMEGDYYYIETTLLHASGEYISSRLRITPMRQAQGTGWVPSPDPQSIGTAISYARRYALQSLLCIAAEDDDANAASDRGQGEAKDKGEKQKGEVKASNFRFLQIMKEEKDHLGEAVYYGVLKDFKYEHSNQIVKREDQIKIYEVLSTLHRNATTSPKETNE